MAAHQAPLSLGFSRQEHWSGLPSPPMHESEKWKWSRSVVSDSSRPPGLQPTRLLRSWDFPGKSTGVGYHFFLQCMKVKSESEVTQSCRTLGNPMNCSPLGSSVHGIFQAKEYWSVNLPRLLHLTMLVQKGGPEQTKDKTYYLNAGEKRTRINNKISSIRSLFEI